ncbi:MAG: sulfatase-like hydrolase/transferase [Rhodobacterales bacterium]|nr:sulfatase-like hydrolase/transferase [Rhodobacterales bacterium]
MRSLLPLLLALACATPPVPKTEPPSILLVTLGGTPAHRLGPYGSATAQTPTWDALAASGITFNRAYTTTPQTLPSLTSIHTGQVPPTHGVRNDGDFVLSEKSKTLAEQLAGAGYLTAAFTSTFTTDSRWGLDQGFAFYGDTHTDPEPLLLHRRFADEVIDEALETLPALTGPTFVWVHLDDTNPPRFFSVKPDAEPVDATVTYQDAQAGRLINAWRVLHPDGIVVLTADHGEGSGYLLEDAMLRVPLFLSGPGLQAGETVDDPVSIVDVAPTLLAMAGLPKSLAHQGADLRSGGTSLPYSESLAGQYALGLAPIYAWTDADGRFVQGGWGAYYPAVGPLVQDQSTGTALDVQATTLAHLRTNQGEIAGQHAVLSSAERGLLRNLNALYGDAAALPGEIDPRDAELRIARVALAAVRQEQGMLMRTDELLDSAIADLPTAWGARLRKAIVANERGYPMVTILSLESMWAERPSTGVAVLLAETHEQRLANDQAAHWWNLALERNPASIEIAAGLLRTQASAEQWSVYVASQPADLVRVQLLQAELHLREDRPHDALQLARVAAAQMPWSARARWIEGEALWEMGHVNPAIDALYRAVELSPWHAHYRLQLGSHLREVARYDHALRVLAPIARRLPDNPTVIDNFEGSRQGWIDARKKVRRPGTGYTTVKRGIKP